MEKIEINEEWVEEVRRLISTEDLGQAVVMFKKASSVVEHGSKKLELLATLVCEAAAVFGEDKIVRLQAEFKDGAQGYKRKSISLQDKFWAYFAANQKYRNLLRRNLMVLVIYFDKIERESRRSMPGHKAETATQKMRISTL